MSTLRTRHWKQHWDPSAEFVFAKRLRMGDDPKKPFVLPGDPVTEAMREKLGMARIRRWWDAKIVQLADFDATTRSRKIESAEKVVEAYDPALTQLSEEKLPTGVTKNGGWFSVQFPEGKIVKCRKADLDATVSERFKAFERVTVECNPED